MERLFELFLCANGFAPCSISSLEDPGPRVLKINGYGIPGTHACGDKGDTYWSTFLVAFFADVALLGGTLAVLARGGIAETLCAYRSLSILVLVLLNTMLLLPITVTCWRYGRAV